jgi:hypothetical protein
MRGDHSNYRPTCQNTVSENLFPSHPLDHNYDKNNSKTFTIDQQFADDVGWIGTSKAIQENQVILKLVTEFRNK